MYEDGKLFIRANTAQNVVVSNQWKRINGLGKTLSKILRHTAVALKLDLRSDGYCKVSEILQLEMKSRAGIPLSKYTVEDVLEIVKLDKKNRFSCLAENGELYIRANRGHSMKMVKAEGLLKEVISHEEIVRGTFNEVLLDILENGLNRMKRNHVHFATGLRNDKGVVSGMRSVSKVLVKRAMEDGMKFYLSVNGVVLTEGFDGVVPPKYFDKIVTL